MIRKRFTMNPISDQFNLSRLNLPLNQMKKSAEEANRFKGLLDNEKIKLTDPKKKPQDDKLMAVCQEFESLLVNQMYKVMRQTIHKDKSFLYGGMAEDIFSDMLYEKYSMKTVQSANFGLAKQIYEQLISRQK